jgi:hypothetical protein
MALQQIAELLHFFEKTNLFTEHLSQKFELDPVSKKVIHLWTHIEDFKETIQPTLRWIYYLSCRFNSTKGESKVHLPDEFVSFTFCRENVPRQFAANFSWPSNLMKNYSDFYSPLRTQFGLGISDYQNLVKTYQTDHWSPERIKDVKLIRLYPTSKNLPDVQISNPTSFKEALLYLSETLYLLGDKSSNLYNFDKDINQSFTRKNSLLKNIFLVEQQLKNWIID